MTVTTVERAATTNAGLLPFRGTFPIAANTKILKGTLVGMDSSGRAIAATTIASGCVRVLGRAKATINNLTGSDLGGAAAAADVEVDYGIFPWANSSGGDAIAADDIGKVVYAVDNQTVALTSNSAARVAAGVVVEVISSIPYVWTFPGIPIFGDLLTVLASTSNAEGASLIGIEDSGTLFTAANVEAALAEIITRITAITASNGANMVGYQDAGSFTTAANVDAALDEIYQHTLSVQKQAFMPLAAFTDADGDPLAKFVDGASTTPGFNLADSEAYGIRWNNHATPAAVLTQITMPLDLDDTADVVVHIMASKTGATVGDAVTFTCTGFFHTVGALHDADANCGGVTGAMTGDATAKTVQEVTLTLASADVPAGPSSLSFTFKPTDGTLGTDDVIVEAIWLEYKGKALTS